MPDMDGIVDYGRSLATVEVALFAVELERGVRLSLRSKHMDVNAVAASFGGGGHRVAAGILFREGNLQQIIDTIIEKIQETGLSNGKKT
jgi:phosphoesterase RecJ-like protein